MALNQIIQSPLVLYSGSIVAHTIPDNTDATMVMLSSSLPPYSASIFNYRINQRVITNTTTTQISIPDLQVTLANSARYLVHAYITVSTSNNTSGNRIGFSATNTTTNIYTIETPDSTTSVVLGVNQTAAALNMPSSTVNNYYCAIIRAIVTTAPTGTPTIVPTFSTENAGNTAAIGPSYLYYIRY